MPTNILNLPPYTVRALRNTVDVYRKVLMA
jgi:hypothetical protein